MANNSNTMFDIRNSELRLAIVGSLLLGQAVAEQCLSNATMNEHFATQNPTCCQNDVCAIPCPAPVPPPTKGKKTENTFFLTKRRKPSHTFPPFSPLWNPKGYGIAVIVAILISFLIGIATIIFIKGRAENFFVAGRSLPLWVVGITLGAQSIDSNCLLGNADLSYKFQFYDGAVLPIGLGLSLILNGLVLARHINREVDCLTLPDIYAKRYGKVVEVMVSCATIVSFIMLLAGNLVGMGNVLSYVWGISQTAGVWTSAAIIWAYTVTGGAFSVAYTDVCQGIFGWSGCIIWSFYLLAKQNPSAAPQSIGFPGYIYPDNIGDGGICDRYHGVPCTNDPTACCYNKSLWCPSDNNCTTDNAAFPTGDLPVYSDEMGNYLALSPFPNAIMWNWATIFILGIGNLAALDFQGRCMAAKSPRVATLANFMGGIFTFIVGIPFSYLGAIQRSVILY